MNQDEIRKIVYKKTFGCCAYCGERLEYGGRWEIDHIVPRSRGGKNTITNYFASCKQCNNRKRDNDPEEFKQNINGTIHEEFSKAYFSKRCEYSINNFINRDNSTMMNTVIAFENFIDDNFGVERIKFFYELIEEARVELAERKNGKKDLD